MTVVVAAAILTVFAFFQNKLAYFVSIRIKILSNLPNSDFVFRIQLIKILFV